MSEIEVQFTKVVADRTIQVLDATGARLPDASVTRVASNGTYLSGVTDQDGEWSFGDPFRGTSTVLVSAAGFAGDFEVLEDNQWSHPTVLKMETLTDGGSIIFQQGTGFIPGLDGRLNPIRDSLSRLYIYGDNLSFDERPDQPYNFVPGQEFTASDARGVVMGLTVLTTLGRMSLLRYRTIAESPLPT